MKNLITYLLLIAGAVLLFTLFFSKDPATVNETQNMTQVQSGKYSKAPVMTIDPSKTYTAEVETSMGNFTINLFADETPITVNNFVFLARDNFYEGVTFHRIIKDFMIQTGDPKGDGTGGPGYQFEDEPVARDYSRGIVAMANSGPDTNGSQFFIMHGQEALPKNYVIFGEVKQGMDTIDKIANVEVEDNGFGELSKPTETVIIDSITISEK